MLQRKRFGSNEKVIAETEAYFESKDESFYKKGIEKLRSVRMNLLHLKETMLMNKVEFLEKTVFGRHSRIRGLSGKYRAYLYISALALFFIIGRVASFKVIPT